MSLCVGCVFYVTRRISTSYLSDTTHFLLWGQPTVERNRPLPYTGPRWRPLLFKRRSRESVSGRSHPGSYSGVFDPSVEETPCPFREGFLRIAPAPPKNSVWTWTPGTNINPYT